MSYSKRRLEQARKQSRLKKRVDRLRRPILWSDGPYRGICFCSREADVLVILHYFAQRVIATAPLPVGMVADLWGVNREDVFMSFLRKATAPANGQVAKLSPPDRWAHDLPALVEYLFSEQYPDGSRRQRSTITVMAGDARGLKVVLNDREEGRSLWATGMDIDDCWLSLEAMLQAEDCPWRLDKQVYRPKGK